MSKGSTRRPALIPPYEVDWRYELLEGTITLDTFNGRMEDAGWLRNNRHVEFWQMPERAQRLAFSLGKHRFERWDGVSGWLSASGGPFVKTFIYRLKR